MLAYAEVVVRERLRGGIGHRDDAIGGNAEMERAGGDPIEVVHIRYDPRAQPRHIEMRVARLQRIERPEDARDAASREFGALILFEQSTDAGAAYLTEHGEHVRPMQRTVSVGARQSKHEADQCIVRVKCPHHETADMRGDREERGVDGFAVAPPGGLLQRDAGAKIRDVVECAKVPPPIATGPDARVAEGASSV